jgi:tRNA modification GTPase
MVLGDTIAAIASGPGRAARGVVRLSGRGVRDVLGITLETPPCPFERGCHASALRLGGGRLPVLACVYRGPASYTGEDSAELLLPGNPALLERVLLQLTAMPGVRQAEPGEFTARAYMNGKVSLGQAEGVAATIAARNEDQIRAARDLLAGRTGTVYRVWAEEMTTLLALVEAGIDFTDQEDVAPISPVELYRRVNELLASISMHVGAARGREAGGALPRVVLAGAPNAGKSTLFNALLGRRRAVASPVAGTTRDVLEEELDLSHHVPGAGVVLLADSAGLSARTGAEIDGEARRRAAEAIARADLVLHCDPLGRFEALSPTDAVVVPVRTKADLPAVADRGLAVCALDGRNLAALGRVIAESVGIGRAAGLAALLPRHRQALERVEWGLREARATVDPSRRALTAPEATAGALRSALDAIGELVGRIDPDAVIGRIFSTFCVGK